MAYIEKRGENTYRITVSCGYNVKGVKNRERKTITLPENMTERQKEKEVLKQAALFEKEVENGTYLDGEKTTLLEFIRIWLENYAEKQLAPSTLKSYKMRIEGRIIPALGHLKLAKIQPHHLLQFYNNLEDDGVRLDMHYKPTEAMLSLISNVRAADIDLSPKTLIHLKKGGKTNISVVKKVCAYFNRSLNELFIPEDITKKLSSKTIKHHHDLLSSIFSTAVEWGIIASNPAERVKSPKVIKKKCEYYEEQEVVQMLTLLENEPLKYRAIVHLAIDTGVRSGELVGLEWSDVDFEKNRITINKQRQYVHGSGVIIKEPKTDSGIRYVTVSNMVMSLLKKYQLQQKEKRLKIGNLWVDSNNVFVHEDGRPLHPHRPYKWFMEFLEKNKLPKITFHALRHTNASLLIAQGTDVVTLSGRLGHSDKSVTLNNYSHIFSSKEEQVANKMNDFYEQFL